MTDATPDAKWKEYPLSFAWLLRSAARAKKGSLSPTCIPQSHSGLFEEIENDEQVLLAGSVPGAPADQIRKEEKSTGMDTDKGGAGPVSRCWIEEEDG